MNKGRYVKRLMWMVMVMAFICGAVAEEFRLWTDSKGNTLLAKFLGFSEDGKYVICESQSSGKRMAMVPGLLSKKDRAFVEKRKGAGEVYAKTDGDWISSTEKSKIEQQKKFVKAKREKEAREKKYIEKAKEMIKWKSPVREGRYYGVKIFQMLSRDNGLCHLGVFKPYIGSIDSRDGRYTYDSSSELFLFLKIPELKGGRVDDVSFTTKSLFWAGEYSYINTYDAKRTVNVYTEDKDYAIYFVRRSNNLYDDGDARFEAKNDVGIGNPNVSIKGGTEPQSSDPELSSFGSGFIITKDGYLVTNYHVIKGARKVGVYAGDKPYVAEVVKCDSATDLAVLKITGSFTPVKMAVKSMERMGKDVFTMGFPKPDYQGFSPKVTRGVISSLEGFKGDIRRYQIDASIQPGNSGGPLADDQGNIVGVVVSSLVGEDVQNVNYAVKKSYLLAFLESLPECAPGIETASGKEPEISFEDAVEKVKKSCVQLFVYE